MSTINTLIQGLLSLFKLDLVRLKQYGLTAKIGWIYNANLSEYATNKNHKIYNEHRHEHRKVGQAIGRAFSDTFMVFLDQ